MLLLTSSCSLKIAHKIKTQKKSEKENYEMNASWIQQIKVNSNGEEVEVNDTDSNPELGQINQKSRYLNLKKKLKFLLFASFLMFVLFCLSNNPLFILGK